jgi:hypothetical protein
MANDFGTPHHSPHVVNLSKLPDVVGLEIRWRRFDQPRRVTKKGIDRMVSEAVEFEVRISEAFPIRALGPALWVGDEALTSADSEGLTYHFLAFEPDRLKPDAPISLGWSSPSAGRKETRYRFVIPDVSRK